MSQYFPNPYERSRGNVKVELDLSIYATKSDFKKAAGVDTSNFAKKADLGSLKSDVDELDIDKSKTFLVYVVDNDVVEKTVYDKLVTNVNAIGTSGFVLKTQCNTDKSGLEKKLKDVDKK